MAFGGKSKVLKKYVKDKPAAEAAIQENPAPTLKAPPMQETPVKKGNIKGDTIKFNSDRSVDVNGVHMSENEYEDYVNIQGIKHGGRLTPNVQAALDQKKANEEVIKTAQQVGVTPLEIQGEQTKQNILQQQGEQAAANIGTLTSEQQNKQLPGENVPQNIQTGAAGIGGAIAGGVAGAGTGALLGSVVPGVGTAIGGVVGGVTGAITGGGGAAFSKITTQKRQDTRNAYTVYTQSKSNMAWIINNVNQGKLSPIDAGEMWDEELSNFYAAERNLKQLTDGELARFLSGGTDERSKIEAYRRRLFSQGGLQDQFVIALRQPNPNAIPISADTEITTNE